MKRFCFISVVFVFLLYGLELNAQTISNFYSSGHIPTSFEVFDPTCNGPGTTITIQLPPGGPWMVTGIDIQYDMSPATILGSLYQRSRIYCQNTEIQEPVIIGPAVLGTASYSRSNVNIANGVYPGGTALIFEMRAWRILEGSGCSIVHNRVDNNTWVIMVHYQLESMSCSPPDSVSLVEVSDSSASFSWQASPDEFNGYQWVVVLEDQDPDTSTPISEGTVPTGVTEAEATGLLPNVAYDFFVRTLCDDENSDWSVPFSFLTDEQVCESPTDLTLEEVSESMVSVSWEEPDFTENIIEYMWSIVLSGDDPDNEPSIVASGILPVGTNTHMVSELESATMYDFYIKALCISGDETDWAGPLPFTTEDLVCEEPSNLTVESVSVSTVAVSWLEPLITDNITEYFWLIVLENDDPSDGGAVVQQGTLPVGTTFLSISDLDAATAYDFYLKSICGGELESDWTEALTFATNEIVCEAPTGLTIDSVTEFTVSLSWSEPGNTEDIIEYVWLIVLEGDDPMDELAIVSTGILATGTTTISVDNLEPGTMYDFYLFSKCIADVNSEYIWLTFMTNIFNTTMDVFAEVSIYPNPTNEFIILKHNLNNLTHISVFDQIGRKLLHQDTTGEKTVISLSGYPTGTYFLVIDVGGRIQIYPVTKM